MGDDNETRRLGIYLKRRAEVGAGSGTPELETGKCDDLKPEMLHLIPYLLPSSARSDLPRVRYVWHLLSHTLRPLALEVAGLCQYKSSFSLGTRVCQPLEAIAAATGISTILF
jgi:hypothetical protein